MKLKKFLELSYYNYTHIGIYKNGEKMYSGRIDNFLNDKNNQDGIIKNWCLSSEWGNTILEITLKGNDEK